MPPKVSKKRKVGRDLPSGNKINEEQDNSDEIEEEDEDQSVQADGKSSQDKDDRVWVQCNNCDRWRALPSFVNPDKLPDIWTCDQNTYDPLRNNCDAPEEPYKQTDLPLKNFLKVWVKRLRSAERAESRMPPSSLTRGRKRKPDYEFIRCCSPSCGKLRAVLRTVDTSTMLKKLNGGVWGKGNSEWYCSMNFWDETTASCAAPQEPIFDCMWNIGVSSEV